MKEAPSPRPHPDQSASLPATVRDSCGLRARLSLSFSLLQDVPPTCVAQMGLCSFYSSPHKRERPRWARHTSPHVCPAGASSVCFFTKKHKRKTEPCQRSAPGEAAEQSDRPGPVHPAEQRGHSAREATPLFHRGACCEFSTRRLVPQARQQSQRGPGRHLDTQALGGPTFKWGTLARPVPSSSALAWGLEQRQMCGGLRTGLPGSP